MCGAARLLEKSGRLQTDEQFFECDGCDNFGTDWQCDACLHVAKGHCVLNFLFGQQQLDLEW